LVENQPLVGGIAFDGIVSVEAIVPDLKLSIISMIAVGL
jgi:hypothetical protein